MRRTKLTTQHREKIALAMRGNRNVLGKKWKWNALSVQKKKKKWKGKTWASKTQFQKGQTAWNKGKKMPPSMSLKMKAIASSRKGEKAGNWIDGRSFIPYTSEFNQALKDKIKIRDKHTCQMCGIKEKDYFQKLSVHHINYDKTDCKEDNLMTVCRSCNSKANAKVYRERATTIIGYPKG